MANWIKGATAGAHGQFKKKAQAAGMSTIMYAKKEASAPGKLGKQARLAESLIGLHKKKKTGAQKMYPKDGDD